MNKKHKLLVILGSTSTGKTDVALNLAKKLNGELVSADSRQLYRFLDIGTGKLPSQNDNVEVKKFDGYWMMDGIKVWMYDVVDPEVQFNVYEYIQKTLGIIQQISSSGKLPILVGGTGLYIRSLLEGVSDFGSSENLSLREELEELSLEEMKSKIQKLNPENLKNLNNSELNNKRRLIRLYEKLTSENGDKKTFPGIEKDFDVLKIGLKAGRKIIRQRIKNRLISRITQGMIEESKNLLYGGILTYGRMDRLGLEYRYTAKFLKGEIKTLDELIEILSTKIGQFAKRQETWFKKEKSVIWVDTEESSLLQKLEKQILDWYNNPQ